MEWTFSEATEPDNPFVVTFNLDGTSWNFLAKDGAFAGQGTKEEANACADTLERIAQKIRELELPSAEVH